MTTELTDLAAPASRAFGLCPGTEDSSLPECCLTGGLPEFGGPTGQFSQDRADARRHLNLLRRGSGPRVATQHRHGRKSTPAGQCPPVVSCVVTTISLTDSITPSRGGQSQPIRPSGRHHDPDRLPACAAGGRGLRPLLGSDELRWRGASRPEGQERHPEHASLAWRRTASAATLQRESKPSPFVFVSERGSPFTTAGFARMLERVARRGLGLELTAHPHMLRHACGHSLANKGHDTRAIQGWLGHRSIMSTAVDTALAPNRFRDFWRE